MISSIAWVPRGVADPNPKRYEMSSTERELLELMDKEGGDIAELESSLIAKLDTKEKIILPKMENTLPEDLRMDEYSSDEEDVDLLMNGNDENAIDEDEENPADEASKGDDSGDSESDREDDDLSDVPDTREYDALNVEGLQAMNFADSGMTGGMYATADNDENSDAEDIEIKEDDAILVVAKTEEVRFFVGAVDILS